MSEERDYEAEARKDGWVPLDEWKGDPEQHKSAEQFVKDGEEITSILRSKVNRLEQKSEDLENRVKELLDTNKQFGEFTKKAQERERKEKEKLIDELKKVRAQAITDGDGEAAVKAEEDIQALRESQQEPVELHPIQKQWLEANSWYETDKILHAFADGIADQLAAQGYTGKAYFDELTRQVKETFPDKFSNDKKSKPAPVDEGHEAVIDSSQRTFSNLPKEAKEAFKRFQRDIPGFTKEQFLEQYEWGDS